MNPIGGYFELEIDDKGTIYHDNAVRVNSGRSALYYILRQSNYSKLYIPYYTCDVILQPLKRLNLKYSFYYLDDHFMPIVEKN